MTSILEAYPELQRLAELPKPHDLKWEQAEFDYVAETGISSEDIPNLIRLASRWSEPWEDWADEEANYAPVHAWRILGQLRASSAVEPLLAMLTSLSEMGDDWSSIDFPHVFRMIGPSAVPALQAYARDATHNEFDRGTAIESLAKIAHHDEETQTEVITFLTQQLSQHESGVYFLNACLVGSLMELGAAESAEVIERAFAASVVDEGVYGDWDQVREELGVEGLGLVQPRRRHNSVTDLQHLMPRATSEELIRFDSASEPRESLKKRKKQLRAKRKSQRQARKKNRRAK